MKKTKVNWDLMELYMKILSLKKSFEESKKEYEEFIIKCNRSIYECEEMLREIDKIS